MSDLAGPFGFEPWPYLSPVLDLIGPFWVHRHDPLRIGFHVDDNKLNGRGLLHAGVIATIADVVIGHTLEATTDPPTPLVTVNLSCDYIGSAEAGAWVDGHIAPMRVGTRLATGSAVFTADNRTVASVRGLYLPSSPPPPSGTWP